MDGLNNINSRAGPYQRSLMSPPKRAEKLFKLDEHEDDPPVAFASSSSKRPSFIESSETPINTPYGAGIRYRGTEYITNLTTPAQTVGRGQILYALPISPNSLDDTRLKLASQMFTRYVFKSIRFYYSGTAPTTQSGSLMMFGDYDPSQNPGSSPGDGALRYSYTHNCAEFSVWQSASVEITDKVYNDMLYCDPDEELRWSIQGCFWLLSSGGLPANTELGKLVIEYEIDFAVPDYRGDISVAPIQTQTLTLGALSAGSNFGFTTSSTPLRGAYMIRVDSNPTVGIQFNVSKNAYQQGAPALQLQAGMYLFATNSDIQGILLPFWTPDVYSLVNANSLGLVLAATTATTQTFSATLFPLAPVSND